MVYLGVDIGGTAVKYGIVTASGEVLAKGEYPVAFDSYRTPILATVLNTSREFLAEYAGYQGGNTCRYGELGGIGVSATGQIDTVHGIVAGVGGNIANWKGSRIKAELEAAYRLPVTVLNDADCAVLAEQWAGRAKGYDQVVMITIGTGVGGGLIVNGRILLGAAGFAGELGHVVIDKNGRKCTCGNRGCYEQYASMTALIRKVRDILPLSDYPGLTAADVNGRVIFEMAGAGNETVLDLIDQWIHDVACGLIGFTHLFQPQLILIGGAVSAQKILFVDKVRKLVRKQVMENYGAGLEVEAAALGNDAGMIGAVCYLISGL